ncbi:MULTISPECIES: zinc ABC transporter substrate-binding protein AdcA [unclassified Gemella]|uniref:zinc ABC transporter substrate-binding protein AdcA n=1 Tax=unclassified Gemella TaxID=2624949 RepID=UPI001C047113|nr:MULTISPECIES: zinc ABC transporter substrate-binding protein AdcA [unclassified Gemella]MBU0279094.1 ZinT/AdcA family metal-binding protein [Gemella sp. zg-1178]QWQ39182.1 ZinT/AdcA family metal-binding protein [Gemella sp. zg-570]
MKKLLLTIISIFTILLTACGNAKENNKTNIVTTFYPIYEFTKQIVGDEANVELLIPAGTEVHDFEPSTQDMVKIKEASAFIYEDDNMETWVEKVIKSLNKDENQIIKATKDLVLLPVEEEEHEHHHSEEGHHHEFDPHLWLSPYRAIKLVENIKAGLIKNYPDKKSVFEKNANTYLEKLKALDKEYTEKLSQAKQKYFVTQHTAFSYLALDYGLKQVGITGISADKEPSIARLEELTKYIKENEIKYIYFEENAKKSIAETLAKETNVQLSVLNPLESLTKEQVDAGKDYISIMKENLANLEKTTSQSGKEILPENSEAETEKTVHNGYFNNSDVKDRDLSDYYGEWQSVYPYLVNGDLDQVFDYKAKKSQTMTAEEYKKYYNTGYKTDVEKIVIKDNTMEFFVNGQAKKFTYKYVGKKILTYKKGNRGVRFLFEATDENAGNYKYVQFSDHNIAPIKTNHFHIFFGGQSQEKLLEEMDNWPTYYPAKLSAFEIAQEMIVD